MKRKTYFEYDEIIKLIYSLPYPVALLNEAFLPSKANRDFIVKTKISAPIDTLISAEDVNKLYAAQKEHSEVTVTYRRDTLTTFELCIRWIPCVYSGDYYCFCIANKDKQIDNRHFGELSLIFYNLSIIFENIEDHEKLIDSLYKIPRDNFDILYTKADALKDSLLKFNKISSDIELLLKFIQEVWPIKREYYDFNRVFTKIIEEYKKAKINKKATFKFTFNRDESVIYCDNMYMTKAILNIFINLLQLSSSENTTLHIDMTSFIGNTKLEIYSNRIVVDEDKISEMMLGNNLNTIGTKYLGLYIAYTIILRHEGKFKITSNAKEGTRISISLPLNSTKELEFRSDPVSPDFSFVSEMAQREFSILI